MGLDNVIYIQAHKKIDSPPEVKWWSDEWEDVYDNDFNRVGDLIERELCYWRKCWNIRGLMMDIIRYKYDGMGGRVVLTYDEVKTFYNSLLKLNSSKAWKENDDSIWTYKEMRSHLDQDLMNLEWLIWYMGQWGDFDVVFVDSY